MNLDDDLRAEDVALVDRDIVLLLLLEPLDVRLIDDVVELGELRLEVLHRRLGRRHLRLIM